MNGTAFINVFLLRFKWQNLWRPLTLQTAMEFIQNLPKPQSSKSNFCKSYFDIPKYAQMEKVLVFRNMLRYEHMDEYGIGTDCLLDLGGLNLFGIFSARFSRNPV